MMRNGRFQGMLTLAGMCLLSHASPGAVPMVVEEFIPGSFFTQVLDIKGDGNSTPIRMTGDGASGYTWAAYNAYLGPHDNRVIGVGNEDGRNVIAFTFTSVMEGSYAYTIFDSSGGTNPDQTVDLSGPHAFVELRVNDSDEDVDAATVIRYLLRGGEGEGAAWYISSEVLLPPMEAFYQRDNPGDLSWFAVDSISRDRLNAMEAANEAPISFLAEPLTPPLERVSGGGIYIDSARDHFEATLKIDRFTWSQGHFLPPDKTWRLVFADEFNGTEINTDVWHVESGAPSHIESGRWPENVVVEQGDLRLLTKAENPPRGGKEWSTGNILTRESFRYGYYEARYRIGAATGLNNAFWIFRANDYEIDINEGHYPHWVNTNFHNWFGEHTGQGQRINIGRNASEVYITYSAEWNPQEIVYYVDGEEIRREENLYAHQPGRVYLSSAVMTFAGEITEALDGTSMDVDYVRIYEAATPLSDGLMIFPPTAIDLSGGRRQALAFTNVEGEPIELAGISLDGINPEDFSGKLPTDSTLMPGETAFLDIFFDPTTVGDKSAVLTVTTQGSGTSSYLVNLQGTAIEGIVYLDAAEGDDMQDGLSWQTAKKSLAAALHGAADQDLTQLWLRQGEYSINATLNMASGMKLRGGFLGNESDISERPSLDPSTTTIQPDSSGIRILNIEEGRDILVEGVTLTGADEVVFGGAGIRIFKAEPTVIIRDVIVAGNRDVHGSGKGAGVSILGDADFHAEPTFENVTVVGNITLEGGNAAGGGGVFIGNYGGGTWTRSRIMNNFSPGIGGGLRISNVSGGTTRFIDTEISGNVASTRGGGVFIVGSAEFHGCLISGNILRSPAINQEGGVGVYLAPNAATTARVYQSRIVGNVSFGTNAWGAGVLVGGGDLHMENTLLAGNRLAGSGTDQQGAALALRSGTVNISHSTIAHNSSVATGGTGGITTLLSGQALTNSLIASNSNRAVNGNWSGSGNIFDDHPVVQQPVRDAGFSHDGPNRIHGTWASAEFHEGEAGVGTTTLTVQGSFVGLETLPGRFLLVDQDSRYLTRVLAASGSHIIVEGNVEGIVGPLTGKTFIVADYSLTPTSGAIEAGNASFGVSHDIDGNGRPHGAGFDAGAWEFQGSSVIGVDYFLIF